MSLAPRPSRAAGAILASPAADRFGRKKLLITNAGIYATGAIMPAREGDAAVRLFARTLIGLAMPRQWTITVAVLGSYIVALIIFSATHGGAASTAGGWCSA